MFRDSSKKDGIGIGCRVIWGSCWSSLWLFVVAMPWGVVTLVASVPGAVEGVLLLAGSFGSVGAPSVALIVSYSILGRLWFCTVLFLPGFTDLSSNCS